MQRSTGVLDCCGDSTKISSGLKVKQKDFPYKHTSLKMYNVGGFRTTGGDDPLICV